MATAQDLSTILLEVVEETPDYNVEELAVHCPQATWNQMFLALDNLSRGGRVTLRQEGPGRYKVGLASRRSVNSQVSHNITPNAV